VVGEAFYGPWRVAFEVEGLVDFGLFGLLSLGACGDVDGTSGEGSDGGTLVLQGLVRVPADVLVGVRRFPEDVELQGAVQLT
jgi:hypothetical protein